jgi:hypothetical protein
MLTIVDLKRDEELSRSEAAKVTGGNSVTNAFGLPDSVLPAEASENVSSKSGVSDLSSLKISCVKGTHFKDAKIE